MTSVPQFPAVSGVPGSLCLWFSCFVYSSDLRNL